jgi:hypothetical protein
MTATIEMMKKKQGKKPRVTAEQILDLVFLAFRYALGRKTYAVGAVVEIITTNWELFEKFEKDDFVEKIQFAVTSANYGELRDWYQWRSVLILHKDTTEEMLETLDVLVLRNERNK